MHCIHDHRLHFLDLLLSGSQLPQRPASQLGTSPLVIATRGTRITDSVVKPGGQLHRIGIFAVVAQPIEFQQAVLDVNPVVICPLGVPVELVQLVMPLGGLCRVGLLASRP